MIEREREGMRCEEMNKRDREGRIRENQKGKNNRERQRQR